MPDSAAFARAIRAAAPGETVLCALEIRHPDLADAVRIVNDGLDRQIIGERFVALRFAARLADDVEGRQPGAEIVADNAGREMMQWIERAMAAGPGATVRIMMCVARTDDGGTAGAHDPDRDVILDVTEIAADQQRITVRLGYEPLLSRNAVALRHDPQTSPGLF